MKGGKTKGVELRCLIVGGNANNGGNAGLFYFNSNNSLSNSNANIGARLNYFNGGHCSRVPSQWDERDFSLSLSAKKLARQ